MSNIDELESKIEILDLKIEEVEQSIAQELEILYEQRKDLVAIRNSRIIELSKDQFQAKEYGCGTVNIETESFKIKTVIRKKVVWDEEKLKNVEQLIKEAGRDPEDYIKYKRSVGEANYKGFPTVIKQAFDPARSVEPSKPVITIERKKI